MSIVVSVDPIEEGIAKKLSGIRGVPPMEAEKMIQAAAKEAVRLASTPGPTRICPKTGNRVPFRHGVIWCKDCPEGEAAKGAGLTKREDE